MDPKREIIYAINAFKSGKAKFANENSMFGKILQYSTFKQIQPLINIAIDYKDLIISIAKCTDPETELQLVFDDDSKVNFYINLCVLIKELFNLKQDLSEVSFEHISEFFLDSLDSYLIPFIFERYSFLPIPDPEYFIDLSPTSDVILECFKQRSIYPHIVIQSEQFKEWSKEAFDKTKDQYFATQNTLVFKDPTLIQYFLNDTHNIDFIINALSMEKNSTAEKFINNVLLNIDYSIVKECKENYIDKLTSIPSLLDILFIIPAKYNYSSISDIQKLNETIQQLQPSQILLLYANSLFYVPQENTEFWNNITFKYDMVFENSAPLCLVPIIFNVMKRKYINFESDELQKILLHLLKTLLLCPNTEYYSKSDSEYSFAKLTEQIINEIKSEHFSTQYLSTLFYVNNVVSDVIIDKFKWTSDAVVSLFNIVPSRFIPKIMKYADVNDRLFEQIQSFIDSIPLFISDSSSFETIFSAIINCIGDDYSEKRAEIALKFLFGNIPISFLTQNVCKTTIRCLIGYESLLENSIQKLHSQMPLLTNYSPFIECLSKLTQFLVENDSLIAQTCSKVHLHQPVSEYNQLTEVLNSINKQNAFAIEVSNTPNYLYYLELPNANSVLESIKLYLQPRAKSNTNSKYKQRKILSLSDYLILVFDHNNSIQEINKEIYLSDILYPNILPHINSSNNQNKNNKTSFENTFAFNSPSNLSYLEQEKLKLVSYVGYDQKHNSYVLDGGDQPIFVVYSLCEEISEGEFLSNFDSSDFNFYDIFHTADFSNLNLIASLAFSLLIKFNNSTLFEKGLLDENKSDFVQNVTENYMKTVCENYLHVKDIIIKAFNAIQDNDYMIISLVTFLNENQSYFPQCCDIITHLHDIPLDLFIDIATSTLEEDFAVKVIDTVLLYFLNNDKPHLSTIIDDPSHQFLLKHNVLKRYIYSQNKDEYIDKILPIQNNNDVEILVKYSTMEYATKVLEKNGKQSLKEYQNKLMKAFNENTEISKAIKIFSDKSTADYETAKFILLQETKENGSEALTTSQINKIKTIVDNLYLDDHVLLIYLLVSLRYVFDCLNEMEMGKLILYSICASTSNYSNFYDEVLEVVKQPNFDTLPIFRLNVLSIMKYMFTNPNVKQNLLAELLLIIIFRTEEKIIESNTAAFIELAFTCSCKLENIQKQTISTY